MGTGCGFRPIAGSSMWWDMAAALPGFGSYMAWLPEYGVGMFAMANLTYVGPAQPINEGWDAFLTTGGLKKRELPALPSDADSGSHREAVEAWDSGEAKKLRP